VNIYIAHFHFKKISSALKKSEKSAQSAACVNRCKYKDYQQVSVVLTFRVSDLYQ